MAVRISLIFCLAAVATPALADEQTTSEAHELANVNQACRVILRSTQAAETSKNNAKKWTECVRTCQWGDIEARYLGFGKGASAWSQLKFGIYGLEFAAGVANFHLPIDASLSFVHVV